MKEFFQNTVNCFCKGKLAKSNLLFLVTLAMLLGNTVAKLKLYFTKVPTAVAAGIPFGVLLFVTPITNSLERHLVSFAQKKGVDLNTDLITEVDHLHLVYRPRRRHQYKGKVVRTTYYISKRKSKDKK